MPKPPRPWTVVPHGPIEKIDDNLWSVESPVPGIPGGSFPRRMSIIRRSDGTLLLHNAVPLDPGGLAAMSELGRPELLVLPSPFHTIDAHAMRARLGLKTYVPAPSAAQIREIVEVDGTLDALPADPAVRFAALDGVSVGEGVLLVSSRQARAEDAPPAPQARGASRDEGRVSMVVCDVVLNVPHLGGVWGLLWRLLGFTGGPRCGPVWLRRAVDDRKALKGSIERLADTPGLARIVPSHGPVIDRDPGGVLRAVAAKL